MIYEIRIGEVMKSDVITVSPQTLMSELGHLLQEERISGTPVVDQGELVGIISLQDYIEWLGSNGEDCPVSEKMTAEVQTLYADEPLVQAVSRFDVHGYGRFAVVSHKDQKVLGILTKWDVLSGLLRKLEIDYQDEEARHYKARHFFEDVAADRMGLFFQYNVTGHDFSQAGEAASRLKSSLRFLGLDPQVVRRTAIATYEAEMNLVFYTDGGRILVRVGPHIISVKVDDSGPGIADIEKALQPGYSTAPEWVRELGFGAGMGLCNIKKCADAMKLKSEMGKGTHLSIRISLTNGANSETN
jgi:CBS domain-containing protein/anti-sigma regulatory factor (Ser/Thr protein kinase)